MLQRRAVWKCEINRASKDKCQRNFLILIDQTSPSIRSSQKLLNDMESSVVQDAPRGFLYLFTKSKEIFLRCKQILFLKEKKNNPQKSFQFKCFTEAWNRENIIAILKTGSVIYLASCMHTLRATPQTQSPYTGTRNNQCYLCGGHRRHKSPVLVVLSASPHCPR